MDEQDESQSAEPSQELWEILEILDESRWQYLVTWAGIDPETGKPWEPSWTDKPLKSAPELVKAWNAKKAAAKAKKDAPKKKGKQRHSELDKPPKQKSLKRKRDTDSNSRGGSESASRQTRSISVATAVANKHGSKDSFHVVIDVPKQRKRRKISPPVEVNRATSSKTSSAPEEDDQEEVIPETQLAVAEDDRIPLEDEDVPQTKPAAERGSSVDSRTSNRQVHEDLRKLVNSRHPATGPRKSNISASKTVLRKSLPKPQFPIPAVSPSVFKQYLPSQDPIEDFSSPEKPRNSRDISDTIQDSTELDDDNSLQLVQEMEAAYIQFTDDVRSKPTSPSRPSINSANTPMAVVEQASPSASLPASLPADQSYLMTLPSTASTQLAVIDSQSQIVYVPEIQAADEEEKLRTKAELASLRNELRHLEDELEVALLQNGEADMQILHLEGELEACRKTQASLVPEEKFTEQAEELRSAQVQIDELRKAILNMQESARASWEKVSEEHVHTLQAEVRRWKSTYDILVKRDQRTDDDVRRKAAEHSELTARINELESRLRFQSEECAQNIAEIEERHVTLQRELKDTRQQLSVAQEHIQEARLLQGDLDALQDKYDVLDSEARGLRGELSYLTGIKIRLEDLLASQNQLNESLTQSQSSDLYVCRYVTKGGPCHGLFTSEDNVRRHIHATHCSFSDEDSDA